MSDIISSGLTPEERRQPRILVVDDDPNTLRFVRDALVTAGCVPLVTGDPRASPSCRAS